MATTTTTPVSIAEFEAMDDSFEDLELLNGEVIRMPFAQKKHMDISESLYQELKAALEHLRQTIPDRKFGRVHIEMPYYFENEPNSWIRPDVSLTHPDQPFERWYLGSPLIAFEIVSRNEPAARLDEKISVYLEHGASEVWVIYPTGRHALVYSATGVRNETRAFRSELLPGVEIPLDRIL